MKDRLSASVDQSDRSICYSSTVYMCIFTYFFVIDVGSFESPMLFSPDVHNKHDEVVDIDLLDDSNCAVTGEYAKDIFIYLREAEVSTCMPYFILCIRF